MKHNASIVNAVHASMQGYISVPRQSGGWCLRTVRQVLEHALGWPNEHLYKVFPDQVESKRPQPRPFYARDIQRSFRDAGWGIPLAALEPGDILTYWDAAPNSWGDKVGHIAIAMPGHNGRPAWVFENISPAYREGWGAFSSEALSLTPITPWLKGRSVEVFRVPDSL